jgi:hypothetical protein
VTATKTMPASIHGEKKNAGRRHTWTKRIGVIGYAIGLLILTLGALAVSREHRITSDWTYSNTHRLAPQTLALVSSLEGPITIHVLGREGTLARSHANDLLGPLTASKDELQVQFLDPRQDAPRIRRLTLGPTKRVRIEHNGRIEFATHLAEQPIANAMYRLSGPAERWIAGIVGHGERRFTGEKNHDLGLFAQTLESRGIRARDLPLADVGAIPDNIELLVLASAAVPLLPGEVNAVSAYVQSGRNLLLLVDPAQPQARAVATSVLPPDLGVQLLAGTIVGPHSGALATLPPTVTLLSRYPRHEITQGLDRLTLFPSAGALRLEKNASDWKIQPILTSGSTAWLERGELQAQLTFNDGTDLTGPLILGVALERKHADTGNIARIVIISDADFLANQYIANQANSELGLRIVDWLTRTDTSVELPVRQSPDQILTLHGRALQGVAFFAFLGLPSLLLTTGWLIWLRRRRH